LIDLDERIDRLVPELHDQGDWERVLAEAERPRPRRLRRAAPVVAAAATAAVLVLAWPFASERPAGVLDRALAAVGEGPVLHVVYRGESGPTLVDLASGEVTPVVAETELWFDPERGVRLISRLGSSTLEDRVLSSALVSKPQEREYLLLADGYSSSLERGDARVIGDGRVAGRPVVWIRLKGEWVRQVPGDGREHFFAQEVAVDRDTYDPVYARFTRDGRAEPGTGRAILTLERMPFDSADFDAALEPDLSKSFSGGGTEFGERLLEPEGFAAAVGGPAFWLGSTYDGEPLADAREYVELPSGKREETRGLYLFYGRLEVKDGIPQRALGTPKVVLEEFRKTPSLWHGQDVPAAREGSVLVSRNGSGLVLRQGTHISVQAPTVRDVLAAAVALRPASETAAPPSGLDVEAIAREVESRKGHTTEVSGGEPVEPRPLTAD
jgi:hypothetical protein